MRTTVTFDDDATAAIEQLRRELGIGISAAVNELVRQALVRSVDRPVFVQHTSAGHARLDVTDTAEVLELLDGPAAR